jgi:hypothetical protein
MFDDSDPQALAARRSMANLLASAQRAEFAVSLFHDSGQVLITGVDVRAALVRVDAAEIVQSVQSLSNSVPLIAVKTTVVRIYLSSRLPAVTTVTGVLRIRRPGGAAQFVASTNQVAVDPAQFGMIDVKRDTAANSLNFVVPLTHITAGDLEIALASLTDTATNTQLVFSPPGALENVHFINSPPLRLGLIAFSYDFGQPPVTHTPTADDMGLIVSWLRRAYPVAQVIALQRVVTANAAAPFGCGDINAQLAAIRALDVASGVDGRTHYYGVVSDGGFFMRGCAGVPSTPSPATVGSGPTGPASWGWDFDGSYGDWYAGHEIGHTFGRKHPGFCGESNDDDQYPFMAGQLSNADRVFAGFDTGDPSFGLPMAALPGPDWHDVMTYCNRQWLSSYTYLGIRQRLVAEDALGPDGAGRPDERFPANAPRAAQAPRRYAQINVVAEINLTRRTGRFAYVQPVARGSLSTPDASSPVLLRFMDQDGHVLQELRPSLQIFAVEGTEEDRHALCSIVIALNPATTAIELYVDDQLTDTFTPASEAPQLSDIRIEDQSTGLAVAWANKSLAASRHFYSIQISDDAGRSWQTVAVGLKSPEVRLAKQGLPTDRSLLIRVQAADGFRAVESIVAWPVLESPRNDAP